VSNSAHVVDEQTPKNNAPSNTEKYDYYLRSVGERCRSFESALHLLWVFKLNAGDCELQGTQDQHAASLVRDYEHFFFKQLEEFLHFCELADLVYSVFI